jgi:hypothetical protein
MTAKILSINEYIEKEIKWNNQKEGYEIEELVNEFLQNNALYYPRCNRDKILVMFSSTDGTPYIRITKKYAEEFSLYVLMTIIFKTELI